MSKPCWENGTGGLAQCRVATNIQFVGKKKKKKQQYLRSTIRKRYAGPLLMEPALDKYFWMKGSLSYYLGTGWPLRIPLPIKTDMHGL